MSDESTHQRGGFWWSILSIFIMVAGVVAIRAPVVAGIAATVVFGWLLAFSGGAHFSLAFEPQRLGSRMWHVLAAIVYVIGGATLALQPYLGLLSLTLFVSIVLVASGLFRLFAFFAVMRKSGAVWLLVDGIVTILLGGLIYTDWPESGHWAIGTLVGVALFWNGFANLMFSRAARIRGQADSPSGHFEVPNRNA